MPRTLQIFDTGNLNILVGPKGLKPGDELTVRFALMCSDAAS